MNQFQIQQNIFTAIRTDSIDKIYSRIRKPVRNLITIHFQKKIWEPIDSQILRKSLNQLDSVSDPIADQLTENINNE